MDEMETYETLKELLKEGKEEEARALEEKMAEEGNVEALLDLAGKFMAGETSQDTEKAISYYQRAVSLGSKKAMTALADIYADGEGGIEKDIDKAIALYEEAGDEDSLLLALVFKAPNTGKYAEKTKELLHKREQKKGRFADLGKK
jgi:TPR repeat protein